MKHLLSRVALSASLALAPALTVAADYTLTISSWGPPTSQINTVMWPDLIKLMETATEGQVSAEIVYNLAPPPAQFDLIMDGAADMTWIFMGYNPGRFVSPRLLEMPGYSASSEDLSAAYWEVQEKFFAEANEYEGVKLVGMMAHGPGQLHTIDKVTTLAEVEGMKIRTGGGVAADVVAALGASRIQTPAPKAYETIASKAADGAVLTIEGRESYRLVEVAPYMLEMPGGFYRGAFALIMNQDKFDSLPDDIKGKLDGVFGHEASKVAGRAWDIADELGFKATRETEGNEITPASAEDIAAFKEMSAKIRETVIAEVTEAGIPAQEAYDMLIELTAKE